MIFKIVYNSDEHDSFYKELCKLLDSNNIEYESYDFKFLKERKDIKLKDPLVLD